MSAVFPPLSDLAANFDAEFDPSGYYSEIPQHMRDAIRRYIVDYIQPGDFLTGVITNDLRRAVNHADAQNLPLLKLYVQWFYNIAPGNCHGSPEIMFEWLARRNKR